MKKFFVIFVLLGILLSGCMGPLSRGDSEESESTKITKEELEPTVEARQFFNDPNCIVWNEGFDLNELKKLTEDLYAAGSPKVMFAGADPFEGKRISAWFVAELPKDKAARDRCFAVWNAKFKDSDFEFDPKEDVDYLDLSLD